jgi:C-22 sterol desaturase
MAHNSSTFVSLPSSTAGAPLYAFSLLPLSSVLHDKSFAWLFTTVAIVATLLVIEQVVWRYKKGVLPGDAWTIPVIGKFMDSMSPSIEGYKKQWSLGDLSALSVFNMFVTSSF